MSGTKSTTKVEQQQVAGIKMQGTPNASHLATPKSALTAVPKLRRQTQLSSHDNNVIQEIQKQFRKQKTTLTALSTQMSNIETSISDIKTELTNFGSRLFKIEQEHTELMQENKALRSKIHEFEEALLNVNMEVNKLNVKPHVETPTNKKYASEIKTLKNKLEAHENNTISSDVILYNIPTDQRELRTLFNNLCFTLDLVVPGVKDLFRVGTKGSVSNPIIVKFHSSFERNLLLRTIANYKRTNNRQLNLKDVGVESDRPIYIRECLTIKNQKIMHAALELKKEKLLTSVFTFRGVVHVKCQTNAESIKINNIEDLEELRKNIAPSTSLPVANNNNGQP